MKRSSLNSVPCVKLTLWLACGLLAGCVAYPEAPRAPHPAPVYVCDPYCHEHYWYSMPAPRPHRHPYPSYHRHYHPAPSVHPAPRVVPRERQPGLFQRHPHFGETRPEPRDPGRALHDHRESRPSEPREPRPTLFQKHPFFNQPGPTRTDGEQDRRRDHGDERRPFSRQPQERGGEAAGRANDREPGARGEGPARSAPK